MSLITTFNQDNFQRLCDLIAEENIMLKNIITKHGYPPMWQRPLSFASLIHIILEQQVSLASALSAFKKLEEKLGEITPLKLLKLTDEEMKACYFSRQKIGYARHLAENIVNGNLKIEGLPALPDDEIRQQLLQIKGIGHWTVDVVLMFCLQRCNLFPVGDIALVNSVRYETNQPQLSKLDILLTSENWKPYKTIAAYIFWHAYLSLRKNSPASHDKGQKGRNGRNKKIRIMGR